MKNILNQLLGSKARVEILTLLVLHPKERFYLREIERRTAQDINPIKRELDRLEQLGVVTSTKDGNRRYISINERCPIYPEIKNLILKTVAFPETLRRTLSHSSHIEFAFIYGSFAKGEERQGSDIDLFVVGNVNSRELQSVLGVSRAALGREINCSNFEMEEVRRRVKKDDHFIKDVVSGKKIFLIGREDEFRRAIQRR